VPTVRTSIAAGETLRLKVIVLSRERPSKAALYWRKLGAGDYKTVPLQHVARGVYTVALPRGGASSDVEYYIEAAAAGRILRFPPTAPTINQTLVLLPNAAN
jgi:hypothetical protein